MTTQNAPYLRAQRNFPEDPQALSVELNKSYVDIANNVNNRTISTFPKGVSIANGENWFIHGPTQKQQALRQVYTFTAATLTIAHGITTSQISAFVRIWGTFVDSGGIWYPLPYVDATAANNQVQVVVNTTNIVITLGAGAPPALISGYVILEWLANP